MLYRNKKTGVIVSVQSEVRGDWERVDTEPSPVPVMKEEPEKKAPKRKKKASK